MNIFILEDDFLQRRQLVHIIKSIGKEEHYHYEKVFSTSKPEELLNVAQEVGEHQIYFLDIQINGNDLAGLEVAREIRKKDRYCSIVFISSFPNYMWKSYSYSVSALDFIVKVHEREKLQHAISKNLKIVAENCKRTIAQESFFSSKLS
ncbi:two-component system, AgrA family, response regulator AgrA [Pilibacter termitis]|uniref:Two-component system, AgrA family, response regulator AgrA n=1 Tax=Pilibacter termitis TaxID=263852 RepID=A0A1T4K525_9ENTE|nr:response regulator [Pilibacter termitis]SJZ37534.1 two-component system, AgrA family, response regulator AgrA [Pilibacter termitis]